MFKKTALLRSRFWPIKPRGVEIFLCSDCWERFRLAVYRLLLQKFNLFQTLGCINVASISCKTSAFNFDFNPAKSYGYLKSALWSPSSSFTHKDTIKRMFQISERLYLKKNVQQTVWLLFRVWQTDETEFNHHTCTQEVFLSNSIR